jgi:hypothetical protein
MTDAPKRATFAIAVVALMGVVATSFVIQAVVLGRPSLDQRILVHAITKIDQYHVSRAAITISGTHLTAECRQHYGRSGHVETVNFSDAVTLVRRGDKLNQKGTRALDEFELAGCPRAVTGFLVDQLNQGRRIELIQTRVNGKPAYAVRVPSAKLPLELFITRPGGIPIKLAINGNGISGTSEVTYGSRPPRVRFHSL